MTQPDITKESLRAAMLERRKRLDPREAEECSARIARRLLGRPELASAVDVGLYSPIGGEVSTRECFEGLRRRTARIYFPRVGSQGTLEFARIDDWSQLVVGYAGILEPEPGLPSQDLRHIAVLIIPGVAFDLRGNRLGWGKGYYDRVLWKFRGLRIALAYDFQILGEIPAVASDEKVDWVVSELREILVDRT